MHDSLSVLGNQFVIMGVLNATPDSFYPGSRKQDHDSVVHTVSDMLENGADVIDVGGESTRPGAETISVDEECRRVLPVIEAVRGLTEIPISVDTSRAETARRALAAGATWINDVSAGRFDEQMASTAAELRCPVVVMHSRKSPRDMQVSPHYEDVVSEVRDELRSAIKTFLDAGVDRDNIIVDPGIGFAKRFEDNLALLKNLKKLTELGYPILVGTSRKSFIGAITGKDVKERLYGSLGSVASACLHGARIFRVHDVGATRDFLKVFFAIESSA
jgi:dihydropteroate synthase